VAACGFTILSKREVADRFERFADGAGEVKGIRGVLDATSGAGGLAEACPMTVAILFCLELFDAPGFVVLFRFGLPATTEGVD
jgi:hypothetical protein